MDKKLGGFLFDAGDWKKGELKTIAIKERTWIDAIPDKLILPCSICGCRVDFDYVVDDDFWSKIVPIQHQQQVICLNCLDILATQKGENVCEHIETVFYCGEDKTIQLSPDVLYLYKKKKGCV